MTRLLATAFLWLSCSVMHTAQAQSHCHNPAPLSLQVRIGNSPPRTVLLEALPTGGLHLLDPTTRAELWSAGPHASSTQPIPQMNSPFGTSLTAVHLNDDGLHDRIYAGDRAGRLWRLDLLPGAEGARLLQASVFADLGAPGRGFIAAPDIALLKSSDGLAWLNIAIGSARVTDQQADNRLYVLRDSLSSAAPSSVLHESDLLPAASTQLLQGQGARGFFLPLGQTQVLTAALTLHGRIHFTTASEAGLRPGNCPAGTLPDTTASISAIALNAIDGIESGSPISLGRLPASAAIDLADTPAPADGRLPCHVDAQTVPECFLDTRPRRRWWVREDAD